MNELNRFNAKTTKSDSGCWLWIGAKNKRGYGNFLVNGKVTKAHRFSFEHYNSKIPKGMTINHRCNNVSCVNPEHLEVMSNIDNIMLGNGYMAKNARKTHCIRGHEYKQETTSTLFKVRKNGKKKPYRVCLLCSRLRWHKMYYK